MVKMRLLQLTTLLLLTSIVMATEETDGQQENKKEKEVVVIEAKEVNGQAVAEDRSDAARMDEDSPPEDQMAVESIDRSHTVYAPPPANMIPPGQAIPVPVSLGSLPSALVIPEMPQQGRNQGHSQGYNRRNQQQRRIPQQRPHPVRPIYAQGPVFQNSQRKQSFIHAPPQTPAAGFIPPPSIPGPSFRAGGHFPALVAHNLGNNQINIAPPPPPPPPHPLQPNARAVVAPVPHNSVGGLDFGSPKNNDLLQKSESSISTVYTGPGSQAQQPHRPVLDQQYAPPEQQYTPPQPQQQQYTPPQPQQQQYTPPQQQQQQYVPPAPVESRKPILSGGADFAESGLANAYVPPTGSGGGSSSDPWPISAPDMPQIVALDVKCEKNLMKVRIEFDKPFNGIIFSKGHYSNIHCVHLPAGLGRTHATFDISINSCGTQGNTENGLYGYGSHSGSGSYFENTIVIQYDPQVQEVWDGARKLRCTWHDQYEKSVTFRPFSVDMLDVVRADFAGDNVGCWMQIQVGKGPWASEVSGLVKIGQTMTMVLAIKDDDNKFDMLVRNCMAHDGKRAPIQLVDQRGCITRPKLMSRFTKIKDFGASASVLSYAHFQAFKFPDSMEVHFQCTIQICRYQCPEQCTEGSSGGGGYQGHSREKRELSDESDSTKVEEKQADVGVNRVIQVVSTRDLTFVLDKNGIKEEEELTKETLVSAYDEHNGLICMSTPGFAAILVVLLGILIVSCLLSAFLCLRLRITPSARSIISSSSYANPAFLRKPDCFDYH